MIEFAFAGLFRDYRPISLLVVNIMKSIAMLSLYAVSWLALIGPAQGADEAVHWDYTGDDGPAHWG